MSSIVDIPKPGEVASTLRAGPAPPEKTASVLRKYLTQLRAPFVGGFIALIGLPLAGGGAYLAMLGGSWYYFLAGVLFLAAGYLLIKRKIAGLYTYVGAFVFTCLWTFWEVGLSG